MSHSSSQDHPPHRLARFKRDSRCFRQGPFSEIPLSKSCVLAREANHGGSAAHVAKAMNRHRYDPSIFFHSQGGFGKFKSRNYKFSKQHGVPCAISNQIFQNLST